MCVLLKPYDAISEAVEELAHHKHAQILVSTATTGLIQPKGLNKLHITMVAQFISREYYKIPQAIVKPKNKCNSE